MGANRQLFQRWCMLGSLPHSISESAPWLFRTIHSTQDNDTSRVPATTWTKYFVWITSRDTLVPLAEQYHRLLRLLEITCQALALALLIKNGSLSFEHLGWDSWRLISPYSTPFTFMWTPKKQCPTHFHQLHFIAQTSSLNELSTDAGFISTWARTQGSDEANKSFFVLL